MIKRVIYWIVSSELNSTDFATLSSFPSGTSGNFSSFFYGLGVIDASGLLLPARTLTPNCYSGMFIYCSSLVSAPALPALVLSRGCYSEMFMDCSSLVNAPRLMGSSGVPGCYNSLFSGCSSLRLIVCLLSEDSYYDEDQEDWIHYTEDWLSGASREGTLVVSGDGQQWGYGTSAKPSEWYIWLYNNWIAQQ